MSDIDTVVVDTLKALDPEWPIREADISRSGEISYGARAGPISGARTGFAIP